MDRFMKQSDLNLTPPTEGNFDFRDSVLKIIMQAPEPSMWDFRAYTAARPPRQKPAVSGWLIASNRYVIVIM